MADKVFIEITEISKKQAASKFKEGELYWQVDVTDGKTGRKARVFGDWPKDWKLGDQIEVIWEKRDPYVDKNGKSHDQWALKDPNAAPKKAWGGNGGGGSGGPSSLVSAWMIAASLMPFFYPGEKAAGKKIKDVEELALAILPKIQPVAAAPVAAEEKAAAPAAAPQAAPAPAAEAPKPAAPAATDFAEDEDKPF